MMGVTEEGYEARQIGLKLIAPRMGKKVSAKKSKLSVPEKARQMLRISFLRRKAQAKAKAQGKAKANAKASPENSVEPEDRWEDSSVFSPLSTLGMCREL